MDAVPANEIEAPPAAQPPAPPREHLWWQLPAALAACCASYKLPSFVMLLVAHLRVIAAPITLLALWAAGATSDHHVPQ